VVPTLLVPARINVPLLIVRALTNAAVPETVRGPCVTIMLALLRRLAMD